jgi:uncharacterized protein (DUF433 family)
MAAIAEREIVKSHIAIGEDGIARVAGTGYKVRLLAGEHRYRGYDAHQIQKAHPDLTLGQVHSVLAYYYDHKAEMDADMDRLEQMAERMRQEAGESPFVKRMKESGLLPHKNVLTDEELYAEIEPSDRR